MEETRSRGGIGFAGALQLIFITLKLVGVIKWPWVAVLIPTWISLVLTRKSTRMLCEIYTRA